MIGLLGSESRQNREGLTALLLSPGTLKLSAEKEPTKENGKEYP